MKKQDIVFGGILLVVILSSYFYFKNQSNLSVPIEPVPTVSLEEKVQERFNATLPATAEKAELKSVSDSNSFAAATREYADGQFTLSILAALPDPTADQFYQAWLSQDNEMLNLGKLRPAKGGWLLEYTSSTDYTSSNEVVVTLESKLDNTPETTILQGSF